MYDDLIKLRFPGFTAHSISELPSFGSVSKEHCNIGGQVQLSLLGLLPQLEDRNRQNLRSFDEVKRIIVRLCWRMRDIHDCRHVLVPSQGDHKGAPLLWTSLASRFVA